MGKKCPPYMGDSHVRRCSSWISQESKNSIGQFHNRCFACVPPSESTGFAPSAFCWPILARRPHSKAYRTRPNSPLRSLPSISLSSIFRCLAFCKLQPAKYFIELAWCGIPYVSYLLIIWLLQQAPMGSVFVWPDCRSPRHCVSFRPTSPRKRLASDI